MANTVNVFLTLKELDAIPGLNVGEQFQIEARFVDVGTSQSVFAAYADINFDKSKIRIDSITRPSSGFTLAPTGTIDNSLGIVNEVGATLNGLSPQSDTLVFTLNATALSAGSVNISADAGENVASEVIIFGNDSDQRNLTTFGGLPITVNGAASKWNFDIDGDGKIGALSDGIMVVRYMFGSAFAGNALINVAISPTATRNLSQIQAHLQAGVSQGYLDIDGNGSVGALSDGIMAVRYMFGSAFAGNALINGAIAPDATRNLTGIQSYLSGLTNLT